MRMSPIGSPPSSPRGVISISSAPIRRRISSSPVRVGLRPTWCRSTSLPGTIVAATMKKAAEEKSAGTTMRPGSRRSAGAITTVSPSRRTCGAGGGEHALGVVAGRQRLDHPGLALGEQPGEEQAGLDLGAGDRQLVGDAVERRALDLERRQAVLAGGEPRAHLAQRLGHAVDRAAADRVVAVERPFPLRLPGEPARQEAQQRPRVADVDRRRARPAQPDPGDPQPRRAEPVARVRARLWRPRRPAAPRPPARRRGSSGCRRRRGSRPRRSPPRPSRRSSPPGGRSTCRRAGAARRAARRGA